MHASKTKHLVLKSMVIFLTKGAGYLTDNKQGALLMASLHSLVRVQGDIAVLEICASQTLSHLQFA